MEVNLLNDRVSIGSGSSGLDGPIVTVGENGTARKGRAMEDKAKKRRIEKSEGLETAVEAGRVKNAVFGRLAEGSSKLNYRRRRSSCG